MNIELRDVLRRSTRLATLWKSEGDDVRCLACAHKCLIREGLCGICKVRWNNQGELHAPFDYVAGLYPDPIEKKPFFHVLPGSLAMTFGMLGCNFHCDFCQNWYTSQVLREPQSDSAFQATRPISASEVVRLAARAGAKSVVSSYNEPFITAEWANEIFTLAKINGLRTAMVSNGYGTPEALDLLAPNLDALKIDLKCYNDKTYRQMGGVLSNVLATMTQAVERGIWVEIVTLLIPGMNDSDEEIFELARAVAGLSVDIPWHVTAYHPEHKRHDKATSAGSLLRAAEIGNEAGLRYVYAGNLPGRVSDYENTTCPHCQRVVVERSGFKVKTLGVVDGKCADCGTAIPGIWG